jgi:hypothetical protein
MIDHSAALPTDIAALHALIRAGRSTLASDRTLKRMVVPMFESPLVHGHVLWPCPTSSEGGSATPHSFAAYVRILVSTSGDFA